MWLILNHFQKAQPHTDINCARGVRHGASRRTRFRNPLDFKWISDFRMDFWISGFQSGFLDFKVDFWISKRISGFQSGFLERFLDFKRISRFQSGFLDFKVDFSRHFWISSEFLDFKADFWISFEPLLRILRAKIYTIHQLIPLSLYANRMQSQVFHRYIAHGQHVHCHTYTHTVIHKYAACSLLIHNVSRLQTPPFSLGGARGRGTRYIMHIHISDNCNYITSEE